MCPGSRRRRVFPSSRSQSLPRGDLKRLDHHAPWLNDSDSFNLCSTAPSYVLRGAARQPRSRWNTTGMANGTYTMHRTARSPPVGVFQSGDTSPSRSLRRFRCQPGRTSSRQRPQGVVEVGTGEIPVNSRRTRARSSAMGIPDNRSALATAPGHSIHGSTCASAPTLRTRPPTMSNRRSPSTRARPVRLHVHRRGCHGSGRRSGAPSSSRRGLHVETAAAAHGVRSEVRHRMPGQGVVISLERRSRRSH